MLKKFLPIILFLCCVAGVSGQVSVKEVIYVTTAPVGTSCVLGKVYIVYSGADAGKEYARINGTCTRIDGTGAGTGNVSGPGSATDNHLAVFDGVTGKLIKDGGAIPSATPAGFDTQVEYNNAGAFGGASGILVTDQKGKLQLGIGTGAGAGRFNGKLDFLNKSNQIYSILVPDVGGTPFTLTLPPTSGSANQFLQTDGTGISAWVGLAKSDVGLGNVDNTSDINKPVSTAQAAADALNLKISLNLSDLNNAGTARTNLGLGTAATQNTGTSGATIPLLNGANIFSAAQVLNLNAASPPTPAVGTGVQLVGADATVARYEADGIGAQAFFSARRAGGTGGALTATPTTTQIGAFNWHGYDGAAWTGPQASISALTTQLFTASNQGTKVTISTTPNGSTTLTTALTLDQDQSATFAGSVKIGAGSAITSSGAGGALGSNAFSSTAYAPLASPLFTGTPSGPSWQNTGTGGQGFTEFLSQSSAPSAPASGFREYADSSGRKSWIRASDGFTRTWDATLTGNRIYTLLDADMTLVGLTNTQALTGKTINGNTLTTGTWTINGVAGKTFLFDKTIEIDGTDSTKMTFPGTNATIARTDAGQTFTGANFLNANTVIGGTASLSTIAARLEVQYSNSSQIGLALIDTAGVGANAGAYLSGFGNYTGTTKGRFGAINILKENATDGNSAGYIQFLTNANGGASTVAERLRVTSTGDVLLGTTTDASANTGKVLIFGDNVSKPTLAGTLPTALYNKGGEQYVQDSAGNETLLSPHNFSLIPGGASEPMAWSFFSNRNGSTINVDMLRVVRTVEQLSGKQLVYINGEPSPVPADMGGAKVITPTPGAAVTLTIDPTVRETIATWTSGEIETVNVSGTPQDGSRLVLLIVNDGVLGRVITMGTGLSSLAVVTGVSGKKSSISFIAYNGTFYETARTVGF